MLYMVLYAFKKKSVLQYFGPSKCNLYLRCAKLLSSHHIPEEENTIAIQHTKVSGNVNMTKIFFQNVN